MIAARLIVFEFFERRRKRRWLRERGVCCDGCFAWCESEISANANGPTFVLPVDDDRFNLPVDYSRAPRRLQQFLLVGESRNTATTRTFAEWQQQAHDGVEWGTVMKERSNRVDHTELSAWLVIASLQLRGYVLSELPIGLQTYRIRDLGRRLGVQDLTPRVTGGKLLFTHCEELVEGSQDPQALHDPYFDFPVRLTQYSFEFNTFSLKSEAIQ